MDDSDLLKLASINDRGSIIVGKDTVIDGYAPCRETGILTHIHTDHMHLLNYARHECSQIYLPPPTFDLLH